MFNFVSAYESIGVALLCGIGLGLVAVILFNLMPSAMAYISIILGGITCIALAVVIVILNLANPKYIIVYIVSLWYIKPSSICLLPS